MPKVALLIGGMGLNAELTRATIEALPPEISLAFAPYGDNLQQQANAARARGHEVFLQLPMEPFGYPSIDPGPRTLLTSASAQQNVDSLHWHLSRFSGYAGVTNYLGAQFAANEKAFGPVLHELGKRGLVYVDDGSKGLSRATGLAGKFGLPARSATITLDGDTPEAVAAALQRLEAAARQNGFAIGTGAGLPATIKVIEQWHRSLGGQANATGARDGSLCVAAQLTHIALMSNTRSPEQLAALPYRPCVGVMLLNQHGRVWIGRRIIQQNDDEAARGDAKWWQMPQGGIDEGEDIHTAALRELTEETGVRSASVIEETPGWLTYDLPDHLLGIAWKGRYRGQKQKWVACRFEGEDREIDISGIGHKPEFDDWRWAAMDELEDLIVPFKLDVYRQVIKAFRHLAD
jgi:putative (di)nucleoside polyphosphate hydrolase